MRIRYSEVSVLAFDNSEKKDKTFFCMHDEYYYTRYTGFRTLFQDLIFRMKIIKPAILQSMGKYHLNEQQRERRKIIIMDRASRMGEIIISENKEILFNGKGKVNQGLKKYFFIQKKAKDFFIKNILIPLMTLIKEVDEREWVKLPNKDGFWREMGENEFMSVGSEVSMNFTTRKKMLRL